MKYSRGESERKISDQIFDRTGLRIEIRHFYKGCHYKIIGAKVLSVHIIRSEFEFIYSELLPEDWWQDYPHTSCLVAYPCWGIQKVEMQRRKEKHTLYFYTDCNRQYSYIGNTQEEVMGWLMAEKIVNRLSWDESVWRCEKCSNGDHSDCRLLFDVVLAPWLKNKDLGCWVLGNNIVKAGEQNWEFDWFRSCGQEEYFFEMKAGALLSQ